MSSKSLIQDMRGESHGLVQVPVDAFKQRCCWANMPPELLTDVLMRIERSEDTWPSRKNVVSCAGVCRNWRQIVKEMVKVPELSSKITFPISLKQPGPRGSLVQCYVKRKHCNKCWHDTFYLYLGDTPSNDDGKFLLAAKMFKRPTFTEYIISLNRKDFSVCSKTNNYNGYMGKLRSNYLGTKFTVYDGQPTYPEAQSSSRIQSGNDNPVAHISYEFLEVATLVMGSRVRRPVRIECVMDAIPATAIEPGGTAPTQTELDNFVSFRSKSIGAESLPSGQKEEVLVLKSKVPRWDEQTQSWRLPFKGCERGLVACEGNFQLVAALENENVILQFAKVGNEGAFIMDYQYPLSAFQAFTICLSRIPCKPSWTSFILKRYQVME